jgi:ribosomal protein S18 acetylase RimI-like enzyme
MGDFSRLVDEAWPAPYAEYAGGWKLRFAGGVTKRANSALPVDPLQDLDTAERFYADRGLPAVFSLDGPSPLDRELSARGYTVVDPTLVLTAPLRPGETGPVKIEDHPSPDWMRIWTSVEGNPAATPIMTGVAADYALLEGMAVGRGVPQGDWYGIYCMAVLPECRRQGLAARVLRELLRRGHDSGARQAYLAVVESNAAARALYERAGFTVAGGYHYRVSASAF